MILGVPHPLHELGGHGPVHEPDGAVVTEEEIVQFCRTNLATYKAPRKVTFVDELPKTLIGKVMRRKLREAEAASGQPPTSPPSISR